MGTWEGAAEGAKSPSNEKTSKLRKKKPRKEENKKPPLTSAMVRFRVLGKAL
jgi:hypothetical protein